MDTKRDVSSTGRPRGGRRRGFTIRELTVTLACLLVAGGLLASLSGANRDLSKASVCASNLETLFGGLMAYVNTYNSFPPHNPYPGYPSRSGPPYAGALDPNTGWILTYGLGMTPPATYAGSPSSGTSTHFKWYVLNENELPDIITCPAANRDLLFILNPELDSNNLESFVFQYAAFYQTSGTCRAATTVVSPGTGGRNPSVADPTSTATARVTTNSSRGVPSIWVCAKTGDPSDPSDFDTERICYVQAVHPSEMDNPSRVYYMADSRDYRPTSDPSTWPSAGTNDGWLIGWGNKILLSTRHYGYANVMYLDGQVNRDGQDHPIAAWNMDFDPTTATARSSQWRCATFADRIPLAHIGTQHHIMPQLNIVGWERFFNDNGVATR